MEIETPVPSTPVDEKKIRQNAEQPSNEDEKSLLKDPEFIKKVIKDLHLDDDLDKLDDDNKGKKS